MYSHWSFLDYTFNIELKNYSTEHIQLQRTKDIYVKRTMTFLQTQKCNLHVQL